MGTYYNTTRMGLAVPRAKGGSLLVGAKGKITLNPEDEGTAQLLYLLQKGLLKKLPSADVPKEPQVEKPIVVLLPKEPEKVLVENKENEVKSVAIPDIVETPVDEVLQEVANEQVSEQVGEQDLNQTEEQIVTNGNGFVKSSRRGRRSSI